VRLIVEPLRAAEPAETLRAMNGRAGAIFVVASLSSHICLTLRDAAAAGGVLDVRFLLATRADADIESGAENVLWLRAACTGL